MKITIDRGPLLRVLNHVQAVVERRNTVPILSNVMLDAQGDDLNVTATDLDLQINEKTPASVAQAGRLTVSAHTLFDIIRKLPDGSQVELSTDGDRLLVVGGRARFRLPILPAEDFPEINPGELPTRFEMEAEELSRMLARARYAISSEETRYYLMGIYFHTSGDELLAVSTDGHRLARVSNGKPDESGEFEGIIIPRKCVGEVLKIVDEVEGKVVVEMSATKVRFTLGDAILTSKVIDGTFPDYNRVIPKSNDKVVTVDASSLAESIDRVSTIVTERTRAVKVELAKDKLILTVTSPEHGRAQEEVAVGYDGDSLEIGFNARYFLDVLNQNKGQVIEIACNGPADPVLIRPKSGGGDLSVIMPMRT
jgi:DNA polymerase-3 subunit beta